MRVNNFSCLLTIWSPLWWSGCSNLSLKLFFFFNLPDCIFSYQFVWVLFLCRNSLFRNLCFQVEVQVKYELKIFSTLWLAFHSLYGIFQSWGFFFFFSLGYSSLMWVLSSQTRDEPGLQQWKHSILTTRPSGNSQEFFFFILMNLNVSNFCLYVLFSPSGIHFCIWYTEEIN